jgi:SAM-dependent methyltransferase
MDSWRRPQENSSELIERTGIPRKVLSRLLSATNVGVGFRVLDIGCGCGELAAYLDSLGVPCTGFDESPMNVMEARRAVPDCEFTCGTISGSVPGPQVGFDLVLVREASVFRTSLLSPATLSATLQLLSRVRLGGCLAFLARIGSGSPTAGGHRFSCYARHLGSLPGKYDLHEMPDGPILARSFRTLAAGQNGSGHAIAVLRLPAQPLSQDEWTHAFDVARQAAQTPCCEWAVQGAESNRFRSKAA